jgi:flagellar assembly factor FliW
LKQASLMYLETRHLGTVEYQPNNIIHFPEGLPAFEEEHEFVQITGRPEIEPLVCLQSVRTPELAFFAAPVRALDPNYSLALELEHCQTIGWDQERMPEIGSDIVCVAILTLSEHPTANLLSPVVIHPGTRRACQVIQAGTAYSCRHPIGPQ